MSPESVALLVGMADSMLDLLFRTLGPDATQAKVAEWAAILAARQAADAAARRKFGGDAGP